MLSFEPRQVRTGFHFPPMEEHFLSLSQETSPLTHSLPLLQPGGTPEDQISAAIISSRDNSQAVQWLEGGLGARGQFQCGNKHCQKEDGLKSWEVNFAYVEHGEKRNALVKLRLCPECSFKLNYHHKRKEVKAKTKKIRGISEENQEPLTKKKKKKKKKRSSSHSKKHKQKRHRDGSTSSSSSESGSQNSDKDGEAGNEQDDQSEADHWRGPAPTVEEKSREEEFDEYFEDMFL